VKRLAWLVCLVVMVGGAAGCGSVKETPPDSGPDDGGTGTDGDGDNPCVLGTSQLGTCHL